MLHKREMHQIFGAAVSASRPLLAPFKWLVLLCRDAVSTTLLPLMLRACDSSNTKTQEEVLKNLAKDALDLPYQVRALGAAREVVHCGSEVRFARQARGGDLRPWAQLYMASLVFVAGSL
jgi:hypothetical protein